MKKTIFICMSESNNAGTHNNGAEHQGMKIMSKVQELRNRIKNGEVAPSKGGANGPKVGEGNFVCRVDEASFGKGESGNLRGMVKLTVIKSENEKEIGGKFNIYEQTTNEKYLEQSIAMWGQILTAVGVSEDKLFDDADDTDDVMNNVMVQINKLVKKGFKVYLNRKLQDKLDAQGRPRFYNNVRIDETIAENKTTLETKAGSDTPEEAMGGDVPASAPTTPKKKW